MNKEQLQEQFTQWVNKNTGSPFTQDPFLLACLDEAIRLSSCSVLNDEPLINVFLDEDMFRIILRLWRGHVRLCFQLVEKPGLSSFEFHGEMVPTDIHHQVSCLTLLDRISDLSK